jgi:hypothetical protein
MNSILYPWVTALGLRHQGVLLAGIRGGDGIPKEHVTKTFQRAIRNKVLVPFDPRETTVKGGFMSFEPGELTAAVPILRKELDQLNTHYIFHMLHALEVIGYYHPEPETRGEFYSAYVNLVKKFHLNLETKQQLEARLFEDRIANKSVTE